MAKASDQVVDKGRTIAAAAAGGRGGRHRVRRRRFRVKGTDRSVDLFEVARRGRAPLEGVDGDEVLTPPSFPYGCAVCEVEVDPETGVVEVVRYTTVDDCGRAVNPMILHGQAHGGIAQGIGQALSSVRLRRRDGPAALGDADGLRAAARRHAAAFTTEISEVPSTSHPLGLRGGGEGGTTPALGAVVNAIVDALAELGVRALELPASAERVWQAIRVRDGRAQAARRRLRRQRRSEHPPEHDHLGAPLAVGVERGQHTGDSAAGGPEGCGGQRAEHRRDLGVDRGEQPLTRRASGASSR